MVRILNIYDIKNIFNIVGYNSFYKKLLIYLKEDFSNWDDFKKIPRIASHSKDGVVELMPINNHALYSFKYVNGHPKNPTINKLSVMATGQLSHFTTGEPILYTEMTILTALRTACTSLFASTYMAQKDSTVLSIIGTGAQSEFHFLSFFSFFPLKQIRYFDIDPFAMKKFKNNIQKYPVELIPCKNIEETIQNADIIITMTAEKSKQNLIEKKMISKKPVFISAIGGDCPGKTELNPDLLTDSNSNIVVEFLPQTKIEGEIQNIQDHQKCIELHELVRGKKSITIPNHINIFDSVGFSLEDYSILRFIYELSNQYNIGSNLPIIPDLSDVKNLYSILE